MSADLILRYGRRFIASARERLTTAGALAAPEAAQALALQLHSISGEAAMIGFPELSQAARDAMGAAREAAAGTAPLAACTQKVADVMHLLDEQERSLPPSAH